MNRPIISPLFTGPIQFPVAKVDSAYAALRTDYYIQCSGSMDVTLPTAFGFTGQTYVVKNADSGFVQVLPTGSETIESESLIALSQNESITVYSDGENWLIAAKSMPVTVVGKSLLALNIPGVESAILVNTSGGANLTAATPFMEWTVGGGGPTLFTGTVAPVTSLTGINGVITSAS